MAAAPDFIRVEVAYADPERQFLRVLELPAAATVADAILVSGVEGECGIDTATLEVGVWSRPASPGRRLVDGDRVEIYRPLKVDPKEARRKRAVRVKS